MTRQLVDQRERLVQAERVAAWRELARRLAHELKNPLFPLRITLDNLRRARSLPPAEFDEVFEESMSDADDGPGQPEHGDRPLQRFCADAGAGVADGVAERDRRSSA